MFGVEVEVAASFVGVFDWVMESGVRYFDGGSGGGSDGGSDAKIAPLQSMVMPPRPCTT